LALAMQTESTEVDLVLAACTTIYAARRVSVEPIESIDLRDGRTGGFLRGVVAHAENRIECVIPRDTNFDELAPTLDGLARSGWDVWAIVPTADLGAAHRSLRGLPITLQPWWDTGTGVCFGRPEIP
jgi:hypothetical protein